MNMNVNNKIRKIRAGKGFSQSQIANKLNISQRAYSKIELGQTKLKWDYLNRIANILDVNIWELIDENVQSKDDNPNFFSNVNLLDQLINQYENKIIELKNEITSLKQDCA